MNLILRVYESIQRSKRGKLVEGNPCPASPKEMPPWLVYSISVVGPALLVNVLLGTPDLIGYIHGETVYPIVAFDWWWMWIR